MVFEVEALLAGADLRSRQVLATRCALRCFPVVHEIRQHVYTTGWASPLLQIVARAVIMLWLRHRDEGNSLSADFNFAAESVCEAAFELSSRETARIRIPNAVNLVRGLRRYGSDPGFIANAAVWSVSGLVARARRDVVNALVDDCQSLSDASPGSLAFRPLWPGDPPLWVKVLWESLSTHWEHDAPRIWRDWYDARLRSLPFPDDTALACKLLNTHQSWLEELNSGRRRGGADKQLRELIVTVPIWRNLFLSHSTADAKLALELTYLLERAGLRCWIAPRDISPGADWNSSIRSAIESCAGVVLLVSDASITSRFVKAEIQHAFDQGKQIVPLSVAEAEPAHLDLRLNALQQLRINGDLNAVARELLNVFT